MIAAAPRGGRVRRWAGALAVAGAVAGRAGPTPGGPVIDAAFPGGNIVVERMAGNDVYLHPDLRDTAGDWFYWYFRVREARGRTLRFHFTHGDVTGARGPAVSVDGGTTWAWMGREAVRDASFAHIFTQECAEVRFAMSIPYVESDLRAFLARRGIGDEVRVETLCTTARGRTAERLRFGRIGGDAPVNVLLTARHHACESVADFVLEGFVTEAVGPSAVARRVRSAVEFAAIPFVDKDGVEDGDQGKNRRPRDHNRDYDGDSVHATVRALRAWAPVWADGRLRAAIDLHCPYLRGGINDRIYMVGANDAAIWSQQQVLGRMLEDVRRGPLPFRASDSLPFGKDWNTDRNYSAGTSFCRWVRDIPGVRLATTFEIAYADASGVAVTADGARAFGADIFRALARYLEDDLRRAGVRAPESGADHRDQPAAGVVGPVAP